MAGTNEKTTQIVAIEAMDDLIGLFGVFDENLRVIEEETGTRIAVTEDGIRIEGGEEILRPGDVHYCPEGSAHSFRNDREEPLEFFAVVPTLKG